MSGLKAIVSDLHANLPALLAVMRDVEAVQEAHGAVDEYWCLGDIAGYGPHLSSVLLAITGSSRPWRAIRGNHDDALLLAYDDPARLARIPARAEAISAIRVQALEVSPAHPGVHWLRTLPAILDLDDVCLVHPNDGRHGVHPGSEPDETPFSVEGEHRVLRAASSGRRRIVLRGHTHVPTCFVRGDEAWLELPAEGELRLEGRPAWLNPGSVGESRVVGDPRAHYAIYDPRSDVVRFRRVEYDIRAVRIAAGERYALPLAWQA